MTPRKLLKPMAYGLVALAFYYFLSELYNRLADIPPLHWDAYGVLAALASVLGVATTIAINGYMWRALLLDQGVAPALPKAMQIIAIAQFGKYLPGNVGHFAGRAALGSNVGIPVAVTLSTIMVETMWNLAVGAGFAALTLLLFSRELLPMLPYSLGPLGLSLLTAGLLVVPAITLRLFNRFFPELSRRLGGGKPIATTSFKTSLIVGAVVLLGFLILGGVLKLQAMWLFHIDAGHYPTMTILFAASWLIGYVVPGAPGGVGVREAMMVLLFTPVVGAGAAVGLGVSMRLATMLGDSLAFGLGLMSRRFV
ncbi:hypothetical protein H010_18203 [Hydrogenophaga taeniospiralis CCUG 15921]|uniref:Flippase-like domain-containing protein n=1 Tax=Hydrogenophaga taeniospiralis CCUG 15921 TaxID=1281780 RepID=A0A9X4NSQ2_9BURK|nr:lysylphosphatidylglycerol synthase domain-containing protein [Hydrogenophaga taeniospiralis]MDG5977200.1 hypothetical protein [Hydrogenophaga taeniospiralis CCUG 15921]